MKNPKMFNNKSLHEFSLWGEENEMFLVATSAGDANQHGEDVSFLDDRDCVGEMFSLNHSFPVKKMLFFALIATNEKQANEFFTFR